MRRAADIAIALGPRTDGVQLHRWLYNELRVAILTGRLGAATRLPSTREFAKQLGLSRGTVQTVFEQLAAEGYLRGVVGLGSFVSSELPDLKAGTALPPYISTTQAFLSERDAGARTAASYTALSDRGRLLARTPFPIEGRTVPALAFRPNQPDFSAFPFDLWRRIASSCARSLRPNSFADGEAKGFEPLRRLIAKHLTVARGIISSADNVVIVGSAQQVFDLGARLLLDPGDEAWIEDPGYPGVRLILEATGAKVVGVPVDEGGMDVAAGYTLAPNAKLVYVTAGRQAPLGYSLALDRRLALLSWAKENGAVIVEDDYDSEYRFEGAPLAALKSLDYAGQVIYCGTFSKLLFPSLRIAYAVLPDSLVEPFTAALSLTCRHASLFSQAVLHEFIAEGHFGRHVRRMRLLYAERARAFRAAVDAHLSGLLYIPPITTGLDTPAFLPPGSNDMLVSQLAAEAGIESRPLSFYTVRRPVPPGLLLGFAAVSPQEIASGVQTLASVLGSLFDGSHGSEVTWGHPSIFEP